MNGIRQRVTIGGMRFDPITERECVERMLVTDENGNGGFVVTANLDHVRRFRRDASYRRIVESADLVVADGMPIVWASRLAGAAVPERVAGSTMCWSLCRSAASAGRTVFLLGGDPGVAERAVEIMKIDIPGFVCAGTACPPFGFEKDAAYLEGLRRDLIASGADIVLVALGSPKQERLLVSLREGGVLPNAWWIGVGISLSFLTGDVARAPVWMQKFGMEWFHRLAQEPRRLLRRYLLEGIPFAIWLLCASVGSRLVRKGSQNGVRT